MQDITLFKIRINSITTTSIKFDLKVGNRPDDTFITTYAYASNYRDGNMQLAHKQFTDFVHRLVAYVYTIISWDNPTLKILWDLKINIMDTEDPKKSKSIFTQQFIKKYVKNNS